VASGRYICPPAAAHASPTAPGTPWADGPRAEPLGGESPLDALLTVLDVFQEELNRRWSDQERSGRRTTFT
jgi:hypothetical protein